MKHFDHRKEASRALMLSLLRLAGAGMLIASVAVAPGLSYVYRHFEKADRRKRGQIRKKLFDLTRSGYLSRSQAGYVLTNKGRKILNEEKVWSLKPTIPKRWDRKWHMLLFDIPGKKEVARHALRARLEELGFWYYQDSVYVHKHDLRSVIEPFANFYDVLPHLRFAVVDRLS